MEKIQRILATTDFSPRAVTALQRAAQLAAEMNSLAMGTHLASQLFDDKKSYARTRANILEKLRSLATRKCPPLPEPSA